MLLGVKGEMVKYPGVIGWKANSPIPGIDSVGKFPLYCRGVGGMGMAGIDCCVTTAATFHFHFKT